MADFVFKRRQRPVQFAWQMDEDCHFTAFSSTFSETVGPQDELLIGQRFSDVAGALALALPKPLQTALDERTAFSGQTVHWPICNSKLRVPIDLTATAIFAEDGSPQGFRGFGMIRSVAAAEAPDYVDPMVALTTTFEASEVEEPANAEQPENAVDTPAPPHSFSAPATEQGSADAVEVSADLAHAVGDDDAFGPETFDLASAPDHEADAPVAAEPEAVTPDAPQTEPEPPAPAEALERSEGSEPDPETEPEPAEPAPATDEETFSAHEDPQIHAALEEAAEDEDVPEQLERNDTPSPDGGMDAFAKAIANLPDAPKPGPRRGPQSLFDLTSNIVRFVEKSGNIDSGAASRLSKPEQDAFDKIARALGAQNGAPKTEPTTQAPPPASPSEEKPDTAAPVPPAAKAPVDESNITRVVTQRPRHELEGEAAARQDAPGRIPDKPQASPIHPRLLDRLPIGVAIVRDRDVVYANDTLLELLGYDRFEALSKAGGLEAIFAAPEECPSPPEETLDRVMHVRLGTGGVRPVDARMHAVPWNGGQALMISLSGKTPMGTDTPAPPVPPMTQPKADEETAALRSRVMELESVLETATDGVLVLSRDGRILSANYSAQALFSADPDAMVGAPLVEFLAPESHRDALDYLEGLASNGVASLLNDGREVIGRDSNGGLIPLFMTMGHVSSDEHDKYCAVLRDITQWKTAEEELISARKEAESSNAQKSDFLAKISHEIRTPLNAIIGFAEVMQEERFGTLGSERYKEYLSDIHRSGSHILSLLNDLLDLAKIEAGHMELSFEAVSAGETIRECVALLQPQANREKVIIRASLPTSVPRIVSDPRALRQITLNLLSNAIKFNKPGGQVIVSLALEPTGEVMLRVRDTGRGMSPADLEAAMQPFRQINPSPDVQGSGLGLPLTKALAEANRAVFSIESEEGVGTLAEITFPPQRVLTD